MCVIIFRGLNTAWLMACQRSRVGVGMNSYGVKCKMRSVGLDTALYIIYKNIIYRPYIEVHTGIF